VARYRQQYLHNIIDLNIVVYYTKDYSCIHKITHTYICTVCTFKSNSMVRLNLVVFGS